ncbi:MAG: hypothetical protein JSR59_03490 [Proteobacteria bacterium]|nr:hypothetical protein [Pseudomonadota bacterium]
MLTRVLDLLAKERWFDTRAPFEHTIHLTRGACLWLLLSRRGVCDTYVKFTDRMSLRAEAARYAAASRSYPSLVPPFIGYATDGPLEVLVCRAIDYRAVERSFLLEAGADHRAIGDLVSYFAAMPSAAAGREIETPRTAQLFDAIAAYQAARAVQPAGRPPRIAGDAAARIAALPTMPQHGDFVLNNLGRLSGDHLVLFDWEDFGAVALAGLDLFTLELSLAGDAAQLLANRAHRPAGLQRVVDEACVAMRLKRTDYEALTPAYALVFRYLKRNYGSEARARVDRLLRALDDQPALA